MFILLRAHLIDVFLAVYIARQLTARCMAGGSQREDLATLTSNKPRAFNNRWQSDLCWLTLIRKLNHTLAVPLNFTEHSQFGLTLNGRVRYDAERLIENEAGRVCVCVCCANGPPAGVFCNIFFFKWWCLSLGREWAQQYKFERSYQYLSYVRKRLSPPLLHFSSANYSQRFLVTTSSHISKGREFCIVFINYCTQIFTINHASSYLHHHESGQSMRNIIKVLMS